MGRIRRCIIGLSIGLSLAACGGDTPTPGAQDGTGDATVAPGSDTPGQATETPQDGTTTPAGGAETSGGGGSIEGSMCDFVTQEDAAAAAGAEVGAGTPTQAAGINGCVYTVGADASGGYVDVKTAPGLAYEALAAQAEAVDGLGVPAYYEETIGAFADIPGDDWMQVAVAVAQEGEALPAPDREASVALLTELVNRL